MFLSISRGGKPTDNAGVAGNASLYIEEVELGCRFGGFLGNLAVDLGYNLGVFEWEGGEPKGGRLLPHRGIWSVDNWEPTKSKAQARKLRYLSNPVTFG